MSSIDGLVREFSVGELCNILQSVFDSPDFKGLYVIGEIINKTVRGGHVYLDLADLDDTSIRKPTIKGIIWKSTADRLSVKYEVGDVIRVQGGLNYYSGNSSISIVINSLSILRSKEGKNLLAKRMLLERLDKAGYLDPSRKKPIPRFVERLAIVSSPEAAGYHDILNTLARRYPTKETRLFEAIVQGANAPSSICDALQRAYQFKPDVIILARGGGSKNDLSCFDDENVVKAMISRTCPIITAIGHQIDVSVCDRIADKTAITPTDAANYINPGLDELFTEFDSFKMDLKKTLNQRITDERLFLSACQTLLMSYAPNEKIKKREMYILSCRESLKASLNDIYWAKSLCLGKYGTDIKNILNNNYSLCRKKLDGYKSILEANSLDKTLARGYAFISIGGKPVKNIADIKKDDVLVTTIKDGTIVSKVSETRRK